MTSFARRKALVISLLSLGLASFLTAMGLFHYWLGESPSTPRPDTGQVCALNQHGYYFYITRSQKTLFDVLLYAFPLLFGGGAILDMRWKTLRNALEDAPKKFY
jgi:hypothetical protein